MEIFLNKWEGAAAEGKEVNAQYDLSCLAEDIIGRIGLGQKLHQQQVSVWWVLCISLCYVVAT
jgi:hypothetical protein